MMEERKRLISAYGKWFDIQVDGIGTICIKELTPYAALTEAARRWDVAVESLIGNCTMRELLE